MGGGACVEVNGNAAPGACSLCDEPSGASCNGVISVVESRASFGGSRAAGEGGGSTKAGAMIDGCGFEGPAVVPRLVLNAGNAPKEGEGMTSVSNAGTTLDGPDTTLSLPLPLTA